MNKQVNEENNLYWGLQVILFQWFYETVSLLLLLLLLMLCVSVTSMATEAAANKGTVR